MAVTAFARTDLGNGVLLFSWLAVPNANTGTPISVPDYADITVYFGGTFTGGGTVSLKGSLDGTNYVVLTDPQGNAITKTAEAIEAATENCRYLRPEVTAGGGSTAINIYVMCRRSLKPS